MAEEKSSFILYADLIHTVKKMPKEKAGELFLTILEYVNDLNPSVDDILVDLVFEPIKQQLKRDLKHWETIKSKRSTAGKASAEAKKIIKETEQKPTHSTHVEFVKQKPTHSTVNGNVTVNVNDTVIGNEKTKKGVVCESPLRFFDETDLKILEDIDKTKLCLKILTDFGFNEISNSNKRTQIFTFLNFLEFNGRIEYFIEQYGSYHIFKEESNGIKHQLDSFLGAPQNQYEGAGWEKANWTEKLNQHRKQNKQKGKIEQIIETASKVKNPFL